MLSGLGRSKDGPWGTYAREAVALEERGLAPFASGSAVSARAAAAPAQAPTSSRFASSSGPSPLRTLMPVDSHLAINVDVAASHSCTHFGMLCIPQTQRNRTS